MSDRARANNVEYYLHESPGREDYWRRMAAPRLRVRKFLELIAEFRPNSLVDLGCGSGWLLCEIRKRFPDMRLCGVDLSAPQIDANRSRDGSMEWNSADLDRGESIPQSLLERFDAVVASEIIEHMESPKQFLLNAYRMAKPCIGVLLLSTQSGRVWETERRVGHQRHFSAGEMRELLISAGWELVRIWNAGFPFHDWSKRAANIDPDKTMRRFSGKEYGLFQKATCLALHAAFKLNSNARGAQLFAVARSRR